MNTGDTAYVLVSAAMVMFMIPGLALFYGGMVRAKNVLATVVQSMFALGLVSVLWVLIGYTLAFGPDVHHVIGSLQYAGLAHLGATTALAPTIPTFAFVVFQLFFAAITPALITGAFAERMKFSAYILFTSLWLIFIYAPIAHWVWAPGGWLHDLGALDFAGGTVVHINAGIAGLAGALVLGKRHGLGKKSFVPHNLPLTILGAGMLWFGWFGFNAGSALSAGGLAASAFLTTNTAAGAAMLGWAFVDYRKHHKVTTLGAVSGAIAGLVAITPAAGFVGPLASIIIGLAAGAGCAYAVNLKVQSGFDDALDVVGVHAVGGVIGALLVGVFAEKTINPGGANGLLAGGGLSLLGKQTLAVAASLAFSFAGSWLLLKAVESLVGLRVSHAEERKGLDHSQHKEAGYAFSD